MRSIAEIRLYADKSCRGDYVMMQPQQFDLLSTDLEHYIEIKALQDGVTGFLHREEILGKNLFSGWFSAG